MAVWRYLAYDLVTNTLLEELPLRDVKFTGQLNRAGSFSAELQLNVQVQTSPGVYASKAAALLAATQCGRTVVYVERDGVLLDGFILWTRSYDYSSSGTKCTIGGNSLWSYFGRRLNNVDQVFSGADIVTIARTLINVAQAQTGGSIGVTVGSETSGVTMSVTYNGYEHKNIGTAVEELSGQENGFDFGISVAYSSGVPAKTLVCSYPRAGRNIGDSGHVFEMGRNLLEYAYPEDATKQVNRLYVVGAGDGADMRTVTSVRTDVLALGWPLLEDQLSAKDTSNTTLLDQRGRAKVNALGLPAALPQVTVTAGGDPAIGQWVLGDYARFIFGSSTSSFDPRFPSRTEVVARIVAYECTPGTEGQELVKLTLN
jgi:hypothetical protein